MPSLVAHCLKTNGIEWESISVETGCKGLNGLEMSDADGVFVNFRSSARPTCHAFRIYNDSWLSDLSLNNFLPRSAKGHVASMNPKRGAPMCKLRNRELLISRIYLMILSFYTLSLLFILYMMILNESWAYSDVWRTTWSFVFEYWNKKCHWTRTWEIYVYSKILYLFSFVFWKKTHQRESIL